MKTSIFITLIALTTLGFDAFAKEVKPLPQIEPPRELIETNSEFAEGTITRLTAADVAIFLPWAQNAQSVLTKALQDIASMPVDQQVRHLSSVMKSVVRRSGEKNYQLFTRFALNRGMLLVSELLKEASVADKGILENALDIQVKSIRVALAVHESDLAYQRRVAAGESTTQLEYANFGLKFGRSMLQTINSVLDASAQYRLLYKTLEMINWDLSRDEAAPDNADLIIDIYNTLTVMDEHPTHDDYASIQDIRRLNVLKEQITGKEIITGAVYSTNREAVQDVKPGEVVIIKNQYYTVIGKDSTGGYAVKSKDGYETISYNIPRSIMSVITGCSSKVCVGQTRIYTENSRKYKIAGISTTGTVVIKKSTDGYSTLSSNINPDHMAIMSGCLTDYANFCVGAGIVVENRQYKIAAIQKDGKIVVISTDGYSTLSSNVDPKKVILIGANQ